MPGLVIVEINPAGQAAKSGLCLHDVLYKYNGILLCITEDITSASVVKAENELTAIRGRELLNFTLPRGPLGVSLVTYPIPDINIPGVGEVLARFKNEDIETSVVANEVRQAALLERISNIQITTTPQLEGYRVTKTLGIITAEHVAGVNFIRDFLSEISDSMGGRSGSMQKELRLMRETCLAELKIEANQLGANAVIGVDLDYSEISGGGKSMLFLVASGTAVVIENH